MKTIFFTLIILLVITFTLIAEEYEWHAHNFAPYLCRVKKYPDRFLGVYWEPMEENNVSKEWLYQKRIEIGRKYYKGDTLFVSDVLQENADFLVYNAYKLSGRWQNLTSFTCGTFDC